MKAVLIVIITVILGSTQTLFAQPTRYPIIPWPTSLTPATGDFTITPQCLLNADPVFANEARMLQTLLGTKTTEAGASIEMRADNSIAAEEGYRLSITRDKLLLSARTTTGMFRGIQTIRQLIPAAIEAASHPANNGSGGPAAGMTLPCVTIIDAPVYGWRGMHLDVSRHFFSIDYLRKFIDLLALYKMNKFHLHLTDDQGWRIEIKKYPLLTGNGAWRSLNNQDSACMRRAKDDPDFTIDPAHIIQKDGKTMYGGYYTQDEMRSLVAYAAARQIDIIPEIDMPGHMMAAIDQYNWLSCDSTSSFGALFSKPICPCLPATYQFAQDIYTEIMDIFPSTYLHIGGDEVDRTPWAKSEDCKRLMQQEGLKTTAELQAYFIRKMEAFFNSKGRKLIGWDEILEGGVTKKALIMYWRTWVPTAPVEAAQNGNLVIMAPGNPLYFDGTQDRNSLPNVYHFNPVPAALTADQAKLILGAQAEIWTEMIPNENRADYMFMPRMTALAEVLWSDHKDYDSYLERLQKAYPRLDQLHVRYRLPDLSGFLQSNVFLSTDTLNITKPLKSMTLRYTTDKTLPTAQSPALNAPLVIRDDKHFRIAAFRPDGSRGDIYDLDYKRQTLAMPATPSMALQPGLPVSRFKGSFKTVSAMATLQPDTVAIASSFNVTKALEAPAFGLQYRGFIDVPADGVYSFYLTCDDGGILCIAGREVVNNDGNHPPLEKTGQVALKKGLQKFDLDFIEGGGGYTLRLKYSFNGSAPQDIPAAWLKH
jgi:hexosaminidase